ncbi:MAG: thioredoxin [Euryarchaeota archaeon]|nr:thioredoxin [Euryarchaeota archaeon]
MTEGGATYLTDGDFETKVKANKVVLVDFYADWCGPCRIMEPYVQELAREWSGKALVAKLDVDANPATAMRFGVMSIPTTIVFRDGRPIAQMVGAQPKRNLEAALKKAAE